MSLHALNVSYMRLLGLARATLSGRLLLMYSWGHLVMSSRHDNAMQAQATSTVVQVSTTSSGQRHRLCSPIRDLTQKTRNRPKLCRPLTNHYLLWLSHWLLLSADYWLWLLHWQFDQKSKFSKKPILLSFSRRFRFWIPFLRLNLQNWSIGTFFIVNSLNAYFKASLSDLLILISNLHEASTLSLKEGFRDILDILAQCNRPKTTPTCTSSLGFSHLYILMLRFIVTQLIVLHSYIIKM